MKRALILLIFLAMIDLALAQTIMPVYTFSSAGTGTGTLVSGVPSYFGSVGQPMTLPRASVGDGAGGVLAAANFMFGSGGGTIDSVAPVIFSPTLQGPLASAATINIKITDNVHVAVKRVFYRPILGGTFTQLDLTPTADTTVFTATINSADPMGLEFYFKADDNQNIATSSVSYAYKDYATPQVSPALLAGGYGDKVENYRMISVPFDDANSLGQVFSDLPTSIDKTKLRLWKYSSGTWTEFPDFATVDRGKGYFIIMSSALATTTFLKLEHETAPSNNRSHLFTLPLTSDDWNLIGNPYPVDINWDSVMALNGNPASVGTLHVYGSSGSYTEPKILSAYQAAFVKVTGAAPSNFQIGLGTQSAVGGRVAAISTDLADQVWELPLVLSHGDVENRLAGIGMRPTASEGHDRFDDYNPPSVFDYPALISKRTGSKVNDLTKDIVPTQGTYIWRFEPQGANGQIIELTWDNTRLGGNSIPLYLFDIGRNEIVDMRQEGSYKFSPDLSKQFKVYYGIDRKDISPDELTVNQPFPNPFKESTEFRFALPGVNQSFQVELELMNSMGQRVKMITKGTYPSGLHTATWNGNGEDGEKVSGGMYFYRMTVDGKENQTWSGRIIYSH